MMPMNYEKYDYDGELDEHGLPVPTLGYTCAREMSADAVAQFSVGIGWHRPQNRPCVVIWFWVWQLQFGWLR